MKYDQMSLLNDEQFRRLTGIKRPTFVRMHAILKEADAKKKAKGGRKNTLSLEDQLLLSLEYIREYRTYFHIAKSYGVSESSAYKTVKWVEDTLIKHPDFALPGRKALIKSDIEYEIVLIDATETPIERPKKNKNISIQERRKNIPSKVK
jgi:hypothetical protein